MMWAALGLGMCGLFLSAFFSGSETGFYRATRLRLVLDAMGGDRIARGLLFLTNHPALFVATALVGNSAANSLISLAAVIAMGRLFPHPEAAEIMATIALAPIVLVYGELLPKNLFLQAPNRLLRRGGGAVLVLRRALLPSGRLALAAGPIVGPRHANRAGTGATGLGAAGVAADPGRRARGRHLAPRPAESGPWHSRRRPQARAAVSHFARPHGAGPGRHEQAGRARSGRAKPYGRDPRGRGLRPAGRIRAGRRFASARRRRSGPHSSLARDP